MIRDRRHPNLVKNSLASCPRGPIDSTATGTKVWVEAMPAYLTCMFPGCCGLGCGAYRRGALGDVRDCQGVHNGDIPREAATFPPRDQSETVWPLAIRADQPSWLLCCGDVCTSKGPVDQVIELLVAGASAGALYYYVSWLVTLVPLLSN